MNTHLNLKNLHLARVLAAAFADEEIKTVYVDIFGTADVALIENRIYEAISKRFGLIRECLFNAASIGVVFGFKTEFNQSIVVKIYPKRFTADNLKHIHAVQNRLHELGYPAPALLSDLIDIKTGSYGVVMEYISGHRADGHDPTIRKELARGLAEFAKIAEKESFSEIINPFQLKLRSRLWPVPHKSTIRLSETSKGAGFIRDRAMRARHTVVASNLPAQLSHLDWGVKNARFSANKLVAIFDWDSLGSMSEAEMVGQAAAQFTADWGTQTKLTPSSHEAWSFINEYEHFRERKFGKKEMKVVAASADFLISLIARYEHAEKNESKNSFLHLVKSLGNRSFIKI